LRPLTGIFTAEDFPALLIGLTAPDDAAVYRLDAERAIVSTVDFFPPVVDDAYAFGAIAAANALSDIYAMGGAPLFAINLVAYPDGLGLEILSEILRGGAEKVREADAVIAGGHTITDTEPKYGLAVTGLVNPDRMMTKGGAQPGDALVLTKALGTGVVTTALKNSLADADDVAAAVKSMSHLNRAASQIAQQFQFHAVTDVTGYSLLGHSHEMAHLSGVDLHLRYASLQWLPGARTYGERGIFPGGMRRNAEFYGQWIEFADALLQFERELLFDPQTSGGLLMALPPRDAGALVSRLQAAGEIVATIGTVTAGNGKIWVTKE
jgi:selenide,water dikinase